MPVPGDDEVVPAIRRPVSAGVTFAITGASVARRGKSAKFLAEHRLAFDTAIIAGHERCGIIAKVGKNVDARAFRKGGRVMVYH